MEPFGDWCHFVLNLKSYVVFGGVLYGHGVPYDGHPLGGWLWGIGRQVVCIDGLL